MDLDLRLRKKLGGDDISVLTGNFSVKESVKNLISTKFSERIFNPYIGTNIEKNLFETMDVTIADRITLEIREVLKNFEQRIVVNEIVVYEDEDNNTIEVEITYTILETGKSETLQKILTRVY